MRKADDGSKGGRLMWLEGVGRENQIGYGALPSSLVTEVLLQSFTAITEMDDRLEISRVSFILPFFFLSPFLPLSSQRPATTCITPPYHALLPEFTQTRRSCSMPFLRQGLDSEQTARKELKSDVSRVLHTGTSWWMSVTSLLTRALRGSRS